MNLTDWFRTRPFLWTRITQKLETTILAKSHWDTWAGHVCRTPPPINVGKYRVFSNKKVKNHPIIKIASEVKGELACCAHLFVLDCRSDFHSHEDLCMRRGCLLWYAQMAQSSEIEAWVGHRLGILILIWAFHGPGSPVPDSMTLFLPH